MYIFYSHKFQNFNRLFPSSRNKFPQIPRARPNFFTHAVLFNAQAPTIHPGRTSSDRHSELSRRVEPASTSAVSPRSYRHKPSLTSLRQLIHPHAHPNLDSRRQAEYNYGLAFAPWVRPRSWPLGTSDDGLETATERFPHDPQHAVPAQLDRVRERVGIPPSFTHLPTQSPHQIHPTIHTAATPSSNTLA